MKVGGYDKKIDNSKLGPTLVIAAASYWRSVLLAGKHQKQVQPVRAGEWEAEAQRSIWIARKVLSQSASRSPDLFRTEGSAVVVAR